MGAGRAGYCRREVGRAGDPFAHLCRMINGIVRKGNFDTRTVVTIWRGEAVGAATLKLHKVCGWV